jgi:hypothetical protein
MTPSTSPHPTPLKCRYKGYLNYPGSMFCSNITSAVAKYASRCTLVQVKICSSGLATSFHKWCISQYGTVDGGQKEGAKLRQGGAKDMHFTRSCLGVVRFLSISCCATPTSGLLQRYMHISRCISQDTHPSNW